MKSHIQPPIETSAVDRNLAESSRIPAYYAELERLSQDISDSTLCGSFLLRFTFNLTLPYLNAHVASVATMKLRDNPTLRYANKMKKKYFSEKLRLY